MSIVKLKGITGEFKVHQQNGVFITLLAIRPTLVGDDIFELPVKIGFREWQEMGGSLSGDSKIKYEYGYLKCHEGQIDSSK